ncbi:MAG: hypothetical protein ACI4JV_08150 [Ruminiclostridium sp.]
MKKLSKATALILSAVMLFGCTDNVTQSGVGDTTPPGESSVTDSENKNDSSATESSVTDSGSTPDNSNDISDENLVKNIEGYQTFSYDSSVYEITNSNKFNKTLISPYDFEDSFEPNYTNLKKYLSAPVVVKCHVVGDSYFILNGKCGDAEFHLDGGAYTCIYTPVIIDEIIDDFGIETDYKTGDIAYVMEDYMLTESYNGNNPLEWLDKNIKSTERIIEINSDNNLAQQYGEALEADKKYREYLTSHQTVISTRTVFLEKGQSYLMIFDKKSNGFVFDNNQYAKNYTVTFDLENDAPKVYMSEEEDADYFNGYYRYRDQWKYLKEKYGEHFKS